jgi:hypothetical protein
LAHSPGQHPKIEFTLHGSIKDAKGVKKVVATALANQNDLAQLSSHCKLGAFDDLLSSIKEK